MNLSILNLKTPPLSLMTRRETQRYSAYQAENSVSNNHENKVECQRAASAVFWHNHDLSCQRISHVLISKIVCPYHSIIRGQTILKWR